MRSLLYCVYKGVHPEELFTRLPSVLFNPVVILKSCLVNLSKLLLYLWSWIVLSAAWEWSGVSELIWHSCPSSPVHIFPLGTYLHTCTENTHLPLRWIHASLVLWVQRHIPSFSLQHAHTVTLLSNALATKLVKFCLLEPPSLVCVCVCCLLIPRAVCFNLL